MLNKAFFWLKTVKSKLGKWFWVILAVFLIVAGVVVFRNRNKPQPASATVEKGQVKSELVLTGTVDADKYAQLAFPTSGKISWVGVDEGAQVYKGQALISLDKTVLNSTYQEALNTYRKYEATAQNVLDQVKDHSTDESFAQKDTRTTAEVNRDSAYDAVKAAKYNLDNATIYAPFAGIISSLPFSSPGVNVSLTDTQVVILDPITIYFDVDADQNDVTSLNLGQSVSIVLDSYQDKELVGKVSYISYTPKPGEAGTNYKVKVVLSNPDVDGEIVRIGMTGDAHFTLSEKDDALYVPTEFVKADIKGSYLKLGDPKNKTYVETGLENETTTEIISDKVKAGDTVYD